jgi:hypothetical protein
MTTAITNKTICLGLAGGNKTYLTADQYRELKAKLKAGADFIILGEGTPDEKLISKHSIMFTTNASDIEQNDKVKKGEWKCQYGYWHAKGQECGHDMMAKYPPVHNSSLKELDK